MLLTLTVDITIQSKTEKQDKSQIVGIKFHNVSDLVHIFSNASIFDLKIVTTRQNLKQTCFFFTEFEITLIQRGRFGDVSFCFCQFSESSLYPKNQFLKEKVFLKIRFWFSKFLRQTGFKEK